MNAPATAIHVEMRNLRPARKEGRDRRAPGGPEAFGRVERRPGRCEGPPGPVEGRPGGRDAPGGRPDGLPGPPPVKGPAPPGPSSRTHQARLAAGRPRTPNR